MFNDEPASATPHRRRRWWLWIAIAAAVVAAGWLIVRRSASGSKRGVAVPPVTVTSATVIRSDLPIYLDAIGTVTPLYTASITSQVAGLIEAVRYREGQVVAAGAPLVDIDPRPFAALVAQAEGTLERDLESLAQARMDRDRFRQAWARRAIAKQQLDDQEKLVLQIEGTVKLDRGVLAYNRVQLGYCHITAPIAGRIGLRLVDPGNVVTAASTTVLAVITQEQPISVVFAISEDSLGEVLAETRHGESLAVDVLDRVKSRRLATGRLTTIDNQIDTTTGTVRLRAEFDNADRALFPNQFVNTKLLIRTLREALVLPSVAIQHNADDAFVYVIADGCAHVQRVTTGAVQGERTQVIGLAPGTVVASSSFEKLRDNVAVTVAPERPPPAAPQSGPQASAARGSAAG